MCLLYFSVHNAISNWVLFTSTVFTLWRWGVGWWLGTLLDFPGVSVFVNLDPQSWLILAWSGPRKTGSCIPNSCESDLYQKINLIIYNEKCIYVGRFTSSLPTEETKQRLELCCWVSIRYWYKVGVWERFIYKLIYVEVPDSFPMSVPPSSHVPYSVELLWALSLWGELITHLARPPYLLYLYYSTNHLGVWYFSMYLLPLLFQ